MYKYKKVELILTIYRVVLESFFLIGIQILICLGVVYLLVKGLKFLVLYMWLI
jgi:hypothetical protein